MKNCINVSQKGNQIIIKISEDAKREEIIQQIKRKNIQLKKCDALLL